MPKRADVQRQNQYTRSQLHERNCLHSFPRLLTRIRRSAWLWERKPTVSWKTKRGRLASLSLRVTASSFAPSLLSKRSTLSFRAGKRNITCYKSEVTNTAQCWDKCNAALKRLITTNRTAAMFLMDKSCDTDAESGANTSKIYYSQFSV